MLKGILITLFATVVILIFAKSLYDEGEQNIKLEELKQKYSLRKTPSVDHSRLSELKKNFRTPQDVTEACNSCHTERHKEIMSSSHWNWERVSYVEGRGIRYSGKRNVINNYCIGASSNELACASCHIGFGMTNDEFDFKNARNVDCMVCHDNSEEYIKASALAGYPDRTVNLTKVAQSVGLPNKSNCGACHFYSGGGNNVKHGDLEEALFDCNRDVDVHMASNGMDMVCTDCHTADKHQMLGKLYSVSSENINRSSCEQCHTNTPHQDRIINLHNAKVTCQACHIPIYAKVNATKMEWYWSEAGDLKNSEPYFIEDSMGNHSYLSIKGRFVWKKNVKPDYIWFNGTADHYIIGDTIKTEPLILNPLYGSYEDKDSKLYPVKIHIGDQIYDTKYKMLIQPKLFSVEKGDSGFWGDFNWKLACEAGMRIVGLPFSGEYGFVKTEMYWPVNHMVSPKEQAVTCNECHTRNNGRLVNVTGFYLPSRDKNNFVDILGILAIVFSILGVIAHGGIRTYLAIKNKRININF